MPGDDESRRPKATTPANSIPGEGGLDLCMVTRAADAQQVSRAGGAAW